MRLVVAACVLSGSLSPALCWAQEASTAAATTAHRWDESASSSAQRHFRPHVFSAGNLGGNFYIQTGTAMGVLSIATVTGSAPF